jgi:hypothetical protein
MIVAGFLFLLILVLFFIMVALGNVSGMGEIDSEDRLQKISGNPKKFKASIGVAFIHHACVITLPIMLFIVFSSYNIILGIVWTVFRIGEGLILIYNEKNYWGIFNIARKYSSSRGAERKSLIDSSNSILNSNNTRFNFAMIFWSIGTLAFSIVLVFYGVVHPIIGWLGIVAGISVGIVDGIKLVKPSYKGLLDLGALSAIGFEIIIGIWLIYFGMIML